MKRIVVSLVALTLLSAAVLPASADVLFSQRTDPALSGSWQSQTSNGTTGFNQAFDNFELTTTGTITQVSWTGFLLESFTPIDGFTITFYKDNFGTAPSPGNVGDFIASTTIVGTAGQVANSTPTKNGFGVFNFTSAIDPFVAVGGTTYWISIVADPAFKGGDVGWAFSDQGDDSFDTFDGNNVTTVATNLAFTLSNTSVPEPSGLVLGVSGLMTLAGFGRRSLALKLRK